MFHTEDSGMMKKEEREAKGASGSILKKGPLKTLYIPGISLQALGWRMRVHLLSKPWCVISITGARHPVTIEQCAARRLQLILIAVFGVIVRSRGL